METVQPQTHSNQQKQPSQAQKLLKRAAQVAVANAIGKKVALGALKVGLWVAAIALGLFLIIGLIWVLGGTIATILQPPKQEPGELTNVGTIASVKYAEYINEAAQKHRVAPELIASVIRQESDFQKNAQNPRSGASGLMQLLPPTAKEMGLKGDIFDPKANIMAGTKYLAYLLERYKNHENQVSLALAGYNAGMGNVDKDLKAGGDGIPNFAETQQYVKNVLSYQAQYKSLVMDGKIQLTGGTMGGSSPHKYPQKNANTAGVDPWRFYNRQCTSYVAWKLNDAGIPFHNTMKGGRFSNAENWDDNAKKLGYKVNKTPKPGAVAQWDAGAFGHSHFGHVAYVTKVEGTNITIEEYNYRPYSFSQRIIPSSLVSNYIHFQ